MKKLFSLLCVMALLVGALAGCGSQEPAETAAPQTAAAPETTAAATEAPTEAPTEAAAEAVDVRVAAMKGPTAIGLSYFMDQAEQGAYTDNNYQFSIAVNADEVVPKLAKGELDMAAIPANLSSVVYNKTEGGVQVLVINTLGVLYVLETGDTIHSIEDLRGKTIFANGKNHTPEQVLTYVLAENGMKIGEDVTVEWKAEAAECLSALNSAENGIAMLPQPFASAAQMKNDKIRVALDLTAEWDKVQAGSETPSTLVTGVVVARKDFIEAHPDAVSAFMDHYKESVDFVNGNVEEASKLVEKYDIVKAPVAKKAIPACNIVFIEGAELQGKLSGYLQILFDQNPKSVGGKVPGDDFYFAR